MCYRFFDPKNVHFLLKCLVLLSLIITQLPLSWYTWHTSWYTSFLWHLVDDTWTPWQWQKWHNSTFLMMPHGCVVKYWLIWINLNKSINKMKLLVIIFLTKLIMNEWMNEIIFIHYTNKSINRQALFWLKNAEQTFRIFSTDSFFVRFFKKKARQQTC